MQSKRSSAPFVSSPRKHLAILSTAFAAIELLILSLPNGWLLAPRVVLAASVTVNSTTDVADGDTSSITNLIANPGAVGVISLREAMQAANNTSGTNTVTFNIQLCMKTDRGANTDRSNENQGKRHGVAPGIVITLRPGSARTELRGMLYQSQSSEP